MKTKYILLAACMFFVVSLVSSCGVSSKDKEDIKNSLFFTLADKIAQQSEFSERGLSVELLSVKTTPFPPLEEGMTAVFSCSFTDDKNNKVYMSGTAGVNDAGLVMDMPERFGKDKIAIDISAILVNSKDVPVDESIYNLSCFMY